MPPSIAALPQSMRAHAADDIDFAALREVAAAIDRLAEAASGLLYGLKYSSAEGMSVAESLVVAGDKIASAIADASERAAE